MKHFKKSDELKLLNNYEICRTHRLKFKKKINPHVSKLNLSKFRLNSCSYICSKTVLEFMMIVELVSYFYLALSLKLKIKL